MLWTLDIWSTRHLSHWTSKPENHIVDCQNVGVQREAYNQETKDLIVFLKITLVGSSEGKNTKCLWIQYFLYPKKIKRCFLYVEYTNNYSIKYFFEKHNFLMSTNAEISFALHLQWDSHFDSKMSSSIFDTQSLARVVF